MVWKVRVPRAGAFGYSVAPELIADMCHRLGDTRRICHHVGGRVVSHAGEDRWLRFCWDRVRFVRWN